MFTLTYRGFQPQCLFFASIVVCILSWTAYCQAQTFQGCCDVKLMDASPQVAIDVGRPLVSGTYRGLSVRFCATDRIYIQIWNMINSSTVQLKWQTTLTPTAPTNQQLYSTINLASNPITIGDNDRLGLYSYAVGSSSSSTKFSVPYRIEALVGNMLLTQVRFADASVFTTGLVTTLSSTSLKRTFDQFVRFCSNADCSDLPVITQPQAPANPSLPLCGCPNKCSPDSSIAQTLDQQSKSSQYLSSQISLLSSLLNNLLSATAATGSCPNGTVPGTYGLGNCYAVIPRMMPANEAPLYCASIWPSAKVVDIYSNLEQMFLYNMLFNLTIGKPGVYSYWTSGIYSYEQNYYVWGQTEIGQANNILIESGYVAFADNNGASPVDPAQSCLVLTIDTVNTKIYWQTNDCFAQRFPICKMPKTCK